MSRQAILEPEAKGKCGPRYMFLWIVQEPTFFFPEVAFENIIDVFASIKSGKAK